jgi:DNA-binding NarL/FixJ family response regulator
MMQLHQETAGRMFYKGIMKRDLSKVRVRESETSAAGGPLTKRELEILRLFAQGLGSKAIADRLSISYTTARNHGQQILVKLGVHSRLAAVARGYARGLIALPRQSQN